MAAIKVLLLFALIAGAFAVDSKLYSVLTKLNPEVNPVDFTELTSIPGVKEVTTFENEATTYTVYHVDETSLDEFETLLDGLNGYYEVLDTDKTRGYFEGASNVMVHDLLIRELQE